MGTSTAKRTIRRWRSSTSTSLPRPIPTTTCRTSRWAISTRRPSSSSTPIRNYQKAYKLAPQNPVIIANAANAAIEARQIKLAGLWVNRATGKMNDDPRVMRERERYLFHEGKYQESAQLGLQGAAATAEGPQRLRLSGLRPLQPGPLRRSAAASRTSISAMLPKEPNFPLLAGHVHKQSQLLCEVGRRLHRRHRSAIRRWWKRTSTAATSGTTCRMREQAVAGLRHRAEAEPEQRHRASGTGLQRSATAPAQSRRCDQVDEAQKLMGESGATTWCKATAYRQQRLLGSAEKEYGAALKYAPNDLQLHLALADTLYDMRRYQRIHRCAEPGAAPVARRSADLRPDGARLRAAARSRRDLALRAGCRAARRRSVRNLARHRRRAADAGRPEGGDGTL